MAKVLIVCIICIPVWASGYTWPEVPPMNKEFHFSDLSVAHIRFSIPGKTNQVLYEFECATWRSASKLKLLDFDWSGDFECRLWSPQDTRYTTLLTYEPNADRDWMSRGRFLARELVGRCGQYPEYGTLRTFKLRGMIVTLELRDVHFRGVAEDENPLESLTLRVSIRSDQSAKSSIAGDIPIREPKLIAPESRTPRLDCRRVRYQHVAGRITGEYLRSRTPISPYPTIAPVTRTLAFGIWHNHSLNILDSSGVVAYRLDCIALPNGIRTGIVAVECKLFETGSKTNLLSDTADPVTQQQRSRMSLEQTVGPCSRYPEWGAKRIFDLRKMRMLWSIENAEQVPQQKRVVIRVRVFPRPSADAPIGLPSPYLDPSFLPIERKDACSVVYSYMRN